MSERITSFFVLLGGLLLVLGLWYLSVLAVRRDTRRQGMRELYRKAWIAAAVALPLFGFALYLFVRVTRRYLTPQVEAQDPYSYTQVRARDGWEPEMPSGGPARQYPMPEPAWGKEAGGKPGMNGKTTHNPSATFSQTPSTIPATSLPLRARYALMAVQGPHQGQQFALERFPALLGRVPEAEIALEQDLNVSRRHAEVYEWNGRLHIRDLDSLHGTLINGAPVRDQALSPGDRITVGETALIFRELP